MFNFLSKLLSPIKPPAQIEPLPPPPLPTEKLIELAFQRHNRNVQVIVTDRERDIEDAHRAAAQKLEDNQRELWKTLENAGLSNEEIVRLWEEDNNKRIQAMFKRMRNEGTLP